MTAVLTTIGFDADDTLWHNEQAFRLTQDRFASLLSAYAPPDHLEERLLAAERRNVGHYGYGVKGFVLSMIETAIEVTGAKVPASVIGDLVAAGREMLSHPTELLPHARDAITGLSGRYKLILITKGDLLDQERKLAQSGLGDLFDGVEIVSNKTQTTYEQVFSRHGSGPSQALMIGNSLRSDVIPALQAGAWAVHVPQPLTWALEQDEPPTHHPRFHTISDLGQLQDLVGNLDKR